MHDGQRQLAQSWRQCQNSQVRILSRLTQSFSNLIFVINNIWLLGYKAEAPDRVFSIRWSCHLSVVSTAVCLQFALRLTLTTCQSCGTAASQSPLLRRSRNQLLSTMSGNVWQHKSLVFNMNLLTDRRSSQFCFNFVCCIILCFVFYRFTALDQVEVGTNSLQPAAAQYWVHHRSNLMLCIPVTSFWGQRQWTRASPKSEWLTTWGGWSMFKCMMSSPSSGSVALRNN